MNLGTAWWLIRALDSGWFQLEAGAYEHGDLQGAVCPIAAAAMMAGIWQNGQLLPGNPAWGTPDQPASEVEEFAAFFDLCASESGTAEAIETVGQALDCSRHVREAAA